LTALSTNRPTGKSFDRAVQAATRKISDFLIVLQGGGHRVAVANDPPATLAVTNRNGLDTPVTDPGQLYPGAASFFWNVSSLEQRVSLRRGMVA
jgi:hypothetical protein